METKQRKVRMSGYLSCRFIAFIHSKIPLGVWKCFGCITVSENIILELSVSERLSHFPASSRNTPQEVARISGEALSVFCAHPPPNPFFFKSKCLRTSFTCINERHITQIEKSGYVKWRSVSKIYLTGSYLLYGHACIKCCTYWTLSCQKIQINNSIRLFL